MSQAMVWLLFIAIGIQAQAARLPDPKGLLKAILFPFEAKVEQITGIPSCEDELANAIDSLGQLFSEGASDKNLGGISEDAYNAGIREYRHERLASVGLSLEERVQRLKQLVERPVPYQPGRIETPESRTVWFVTYLVNEFAKLEESAMVNRAIRDLEDVMAPSRQIRPLEIYYLSGEKGRAFRLILFCRDSLMRLGVDYEDAFKIFVEAFLTEDIIRESLDVRQLQNTQGLFLWLKEHNPVLYFFFLEKYLPFTTEDFLLDVPR